eukprot:118357-Rhodomonas_salina.1
MSRFWPGCACCVCCRAVLNEDGWENGEEAREIGRGCPVVTWRAPRRRVCGEGGGDVAAVPRAGHRHARPSPSEVRPPPTSPDPQADSLIPNSEFRIPNTHSLHPDQFRLPTLQLPTSSAGSCLSCPVQGRRADSARCAVACACVAAANRATRSSAWCCPRCVAAREKRVGADRLVLCVCVLRAGRRGGGAVRVHEEGHVAHPQ